MIEYHEIKEFLNRKLTTRVLKDFKSQYNYEYSVISRWLKYHYPEITDMRVLKIIKHLSKTGIRTIPKCSICDNKCYFHFSNSKFSTGCSLDHANSSRRYNGINTMKSVVDENGVSDWEKKKSLTSVKMNSMTKEKRDLRSRKTSETKKKLVNSEGLNIFHIGARKARNSVYKRYGTFWTYCNHGEYKGHKYGSSFELEFLKELDELDLLHNLSKAPVIKNYSECRNYYPDFFYEIDNLIIEIKSHFTLIKEWDQNYLKFKKVIEDGFDLYLVVNKSDYYWIRNLEDLNNLSVVYKPI